jgi:hypothetical protein
LKEYAPEAATLFIKIVSNSSSQNLEKFANTLECLVNGDQDQVLVKNATEVLIQKAIKLACEEFERGEIVYSLYLFEALFKLGKGFDAAEKFVTERHGDVYAKSLFKLMEKYGNQQNYPELSSFLIAFRKEFLSSGEYRLLNETPYALWFGIKASSDFEYTDGYSPRGNRSELFKGLIPAGESRSFDLKYGDWKLFTGRCFGSENAFKRYDAKFSISIALANYESIGISEIKMVYKIENGKELIGTSEKRSPIDCECPHCDKFIQNGELAAILIPCGHIVHSACWENRSKTERALVSGCRKCESPVKNTIPFTAYDSDTDWFVISKKFWDEQHIVTTATTTTINN